MRKFFSSGLIALMAASAALGLFSPATSAHYVCETGDDQTPPVGTNGLPDLAVTGIEYSILHNGLGQETGYEIETSFSNLPDGDCVHKTTNQTPPPPDDLKVLVDGNLIEFYFTGDFREPNGNHIIGETTDTYTIPCPVSPCLNPGTHKWPVWSDDFIVTPFYFVDANQAWGCFDARVNWHLLYGLGHSGNGTWYYPEHDDGTMYGGVTRLNHTDNVWQVNLYETAISASQSIMAYFGVHNLYGGGAISYEVTHDGPQGWVVDITEIDMEEVPAWGWGFLEVEVTAPGQITTYPTITITAHDETMEGEFDNISILELHAPA